MTAIVTSGETRQSLATVRALGRALVPVAVCARKRPALAMWSRYASSTFLSEDESIAPVKFAEQIGEELRGRSGTCVFASTDNAWWALSRFRECLPISAQRILPPHYSVVRSLDLEALHHFAASLNIRCANLIRVPENVSEGDVVELLRDQNFPLLIRPVIPWLEREEGITPGFSRLVVQNKAHLIAMMKEWPRLKNGFLVSAYDAKRAIAYFGVADKGKVLVEGFSERLNELEPHYEVATLCETIPPIPKIRKIAQNLLNALHWQGPFKLEFINDAMGNLLLIELVGRLWGSLTLAIRAGVNIPLICYALSLENLTEELLKSAKPRVRMRWLLGDATAKIMNPWQMIGFGRKFVISDFKNVIASHFGNNRIITVYDVLDLDDPMPFIFELQNRTWRRALKPRS